MGSRQAQGIVFSSATHLTRTVRVLHCLQRQIGMERHGRTEQHNVPRNGFLVLVDRMVSTAVPTVRACRSSISTRSRFFNGNPFPSPISSSTTVRYPDSWRNCLIERGAHRRRTVCGALRRRLLSGFYYVVNFTSEISFQLQPGVRNGNVRDLVVVNETCKCSIESHPVSRTQKGGGRIKVKTECSKIKKKSKKKAKEGVQ